MPNLRDAHYQNEDAELYVVLTKTPTGYMAALFVPTNLAHLETQDCTWVNTYRRIEQGEAAFEAWCKKLSNEGWRLIERRDGVGNA